MWSISWIWKKAKKHCDDEREKQKEKVVEVQREEEEEGERESEWNEVKRSPKRENAKEGSYVHRREVSDPMSLSIIFFSSSLFCSAIIYCFKIFNFKKKKVYFVYAKII